MSSSSAVEDSPVEGVAQDGAQAATWHRPVAWLLMLASGFAGLGYQLVWTQQCALWLGHESAAVLAVVAAFFGGIALGALWLGDRIERSQRPAHWYAACELLIALWGVTLLWLMPMASDVLLSAMGTQPSPLSQWTWAFVGTLGLLLPATMAMGATLPAIERVMTLQLREALPTEHANPTSVRRSIAFYYASNTLGAVLGVLATAFWLVPGVGLSRTAGLCVMLNLLCAVAAWLAFGAASPSTPMSAEDERVKLPATTTAGRMLLWQLALTGLLGIGYEVLVVRVLSQVAEDTVYTFAMLLAVYLIGTALGAAAYQRRTQGDQTEGKQDVRAWTDRLLWGLAIACVLGACSLWGSEWLLTSLHHVLGDSMAAAVAGEAGIAVMAFALPTVAMGALFSHLSDQACTQGIGFGKALGVNTLGAAAAPLVFGVLLAPALGPKWALMLLPVAYMALTRWRAGDDASAEPTMPWLVLPAALALLVALLAPPLAFITIPEGGHVLSYQDGVMAAVSVVEDADGVARLRINNRQQEGSSATLMVDGRQAILPMLLHASPHRALFLGLGTGVTSGTAAEDPTLSVDAVELLPEVIQASRHFARVFDRDAPNERLHVMPADARRYVRTTSEHYDLVIADNFQPARSGSGALYTVEHFRAVKARLNEGGLFCQWLPLHQLDTATLRSIVQSFMLVYPRGMAILANNSLETPVIGLVGRHDDGLFDVAALRSRLARNVMPRSPAAFGIHDELALLGSVVAGADALNRFAFDVRANTDDLPVVAYKAPRITYAPQTQPAERLMALLQEWRASPEDVLSSPQADPALSKRLADYWLARNQFLEAGQHILPTADVHAMLDQVRAPLLDVLRTSPDFRPAYEPLVGMAMALAQTDPADARALLRDLVALQPAWPEARQALRQLR